MLKKYENSKTVYFVQHLNSLLTLMPMKSTKICIPKNNNESSI